MIEAVGWQYFDEFFAVCSRLTAPGGALFLQAIVIGDDALRGREGRAQLREQAHLPGRLPALAAADHRARARARDARSPTVTTSAPTTPRTLAIWRERFNDAGAGPARARLRRALRPALELLPRVLARGLSRAPDPRPAAGPCEARLAGPARRMAIAFTRAGSGEPLVLIHGLGGSRRIWEPVIDRLAAERDVIAVDLPGFGASPVLPHGIAAEPRQPRRARSPTSARSSGSSAPTWPATRSAPGRRSSSPSATAPRRSARSRRPGCGGAPLGPRRRRLARLGAAPAPAAPASARLGAGAGGAAANHRRATRAPLGRRGEGARRATGSTRPATRRRTTQMRAHVFEDPRPGHRRRPRSRGAPRTAWSGRRGASGCRRGRATSSSRGSATRRPGTTRRGSRSCCWWPATRIRSGPGAARPARTRSPCRSCGGRGGR